MRNRTTERRGGKKEQRNEHTRSLGPGCATRLRSVPTKKGQNKGARRCREKQIAAGAACKSRNRWLSFGRPGGRGAPTHPLPPSVRLSLSCSSNHGITVSSTSLFGMTWLVLSNETLQPKPLNRRIPERENGAVDRKSASLGRWGVFMW